MKRILFSILASGMCAGAMAIPAKPGFVAYTQPDGTVINVMLVGDEHGHMAYTESGLLLLETNGRMEYARFNDEGLAIPSGISAGSKLDEKLFALQMQPKESLDRWAEKLNQNKASRIGTLQMHSSRKMSTRAEETGDVEEDGRLVPMNFGRCMSTFPVLGVQKGLVVLVEYSDLSFTYGDYDYFHRMLNEEGFSDYDSLGSARDWFIENSGGNFLPDFDVYGPVKLANTREYYGGNDFYGNDLRPEEMAIEACQMLDDSVDFSQYDRDGDGIIDNVFIFYAGKGEHDSGIANAVWPHSWDVSAVHPYEEFIFDGVRLNHYACTCEFPSGYKRPDGIGTFIHEFSHVIGLPDLYNTTNMNAAYTPGEWSVLDKGPYNNDRLTPPNYSSFEKCALGWLEFEPFKEGAMEIPDLSSTNVAYALPTEKENEFYFFENRQQHGNDAYLPGHGMLVWHVDYKMGSWENNSVNNLSAHQNVDLVEADNVKSTSTRNADSFPGLKQVTSFGFETKPQLASWAKKRLAFDLADIAETEDGLITFNAIDYNSNAVETIESANPDAGEGVYFDIMGRRVNNPGKGVYIVNGKKILIK